MRILTIAALALASVIGLSNVSSATPPAPAVAPVKSPKLIDADNLPAQVDLIVGQEVFFYRRPSLGMEVTVTSPSPNLKVVSKALWPQIIRGRILTGFEAVKAGPLEVEINRTIVAPGAVTKTLKVKVVVSAAQPVSPPRVLPRPQAVVTFDLTKPLPAKLELQVGQTVVFENGSGQIVAKETDNKGTILESRPHNTFNQAAAFRAKRVGSGEITVTLPSQGLLTVISSHKIQITVIN